MSVSLLSPDIVLVDAAPPKTTSSRKYPVHAAEPIKIGVKGFMFNPVTITVPAGSQVTWVNLDDEPHTVASDTGLFRSGGLDTNESFSFKFDKPGTYHYTCSIHPKMVGTVVVQ